MLAGRHESRQSKASPSTVIDHTDVLLALSHRCFYAALPRLRHRSEAEIDQATSEEAAFLDRQARPDTPVGFPIAFRHEDRPMA
jgi:hypothetical protein